MKTTPLLIFFDIETTGLSIYDDHITEMAAKVVGMPQFGISQPSFTSLVHTSRNISKKGKSTTKKITVIYQIFLLWIILVSEKTGIAAAVLRNEKPLSKVLPEFLKWIYITTQEVSEETSALYHPGTSLKFLVSILYNNNPPFALFTF